MNARMARFSPGACVASHWERSVTWWGRGMTHEAPAEFFCEPDTVIMYYKVGPPSYKLVYNPHKL